MEERKVKLVRKENPIVPDGTHMLSGVDEFRITDDWLDVDGWSILLDDEMYIAYHDPDDGYRSYAGIRKATAEEAAKINIINKFPPQEVLSSSYRETIEEDGWCQRDAETFRLTNCRGDLVLEVSTDFSDDYYPCGHVGYHPENLPINLNH